MTQKKVIVEHILTKWLESTELILKFEYTVSRFQYQPKTFDQSISTGTEMWKKDVETDISCVSYINWKKKFSLGQFENKTHLVSIQCTYLTE